MSQSKNTYSIMMKITLGETLITNNTLNPIFMSYFFLVSTFVRESPVVHTKIEHIKILAKIRHYRKK